MLEKSAAGYAFLQRKVKEHVGIDLAMYKDRQMMRRLTGYLQRHNLPSFYALGRLIERDPDALRALREFLTINVTEFFRNPASFETLKSRVLPELARVGEPLRIWSAGTANGAEAYSLAILLEELRLGPEHRIMATDIDQGALDEARTGIYGPMHLKEVSDARRRLFFEAVGEETWRIRPGVAARVAFRRHDLLRDPYPSPTHLILCRNVVIYFTEEAKERIYLGFARSLVPGGYLLVGGTESILRPARFGLESAGPFLYRRTEVAV
ncbi:MAG: protein-glutamate O-methyltransferase CheR [Firmicutes bacterium]|nr:protein-glutamate O-methyltransferase CheR [Bacillota bacterium]